MLRQFHKTVVGALEKLVSAALVEAITLHWAHPTSFLLFISLGGILIVAVIAIYLLAIVTAGSLAPGNVPTLGTHFDRSYVAFTA